MPNNKRGNPMNRLHKQNQRRTFLTKATQTGAAAFVVGVGRSWSVSAEGSEIATNPEAASAKPVSPIRIGILLGTIRTGSLAARLDAVKASGLDCVQLSMDCAGLPMMPDVISPELAKQIRSEAAARGITLASVAGTFNMRHPDAEFRQKGLQRLRVIAEACPAMGVKKIHLCSGTRDRTSMWRAHANRAC